MPTFTATLKHPSKQKKKNKLGHTAKHRLRSIAKDVQTMQDLATELRNGSHGESGDDDSWSNHLVAHALQHWKVVGNERCGSWYVPPTLTNYKNNDNNNDSIIPAENDSPPFCYFKSTDGHVNVWDFSLKRLNLELLNKVVAIDGGCLVVDASVRKLLPDSFSRTIPIWATVLNRFVLRCNESTTLGGANRHEGQWEPKCWDTHLHTPRGIVSQEEHDTMSNLIEDRVETLIKSGAIVNKNGLKLTKPLRVVWMNHEGKLFPSNHLPADALETQRLEDFLEKYFVIVCWNPSKYQIVETKNSSCSELIVVKKHQTEWINETTNETSTEDTALGYYYTPGAADDHESWARHLTPNLFRKHKEVLLDPLLDDHQVNDAIDSFVHQEKQACSDLQNPTHDHQRNTMEGGECLPIVYSYSDKIGDLNLWIGSRRAGRPPECWLGFDAILNVTNQEYDNLFNNDENSIETLSKNRFYLQLPVEEGKRDRTQLERWMPIGLAFLIHHLQEGRRVLVHCAQGKDRSVAVALLLVVIACPLQFPLKPKAGFTSRVWELSTLVDSREEMNTNDVLNNSSMENRNINDEQSPTKTDTQLYLSSGILETVVKRLLGPNGRDIFLLWIHHQLQESTQNVPTTLADKEGVRIALHLIRQDREVAEPTRSTMQKINRFLMSSSIYRRGTPTEAILGQVESNKSKCPDSH